MEHSEEPLNGYEQARQQRIIRNRDMLNSLGLTVSTAAGPKPPQASANRKVKSSKPQASPRRSKRLLGHIVPSHGDTLNKSAFKELRKLPNSLSRGTMDSHYAHNLRRVRYMNPSALMQRIRSISNRAKMESFVQVLHDVGLSDLAAEAELKLASL
ncbi:hypothetical protein ABBQ38_008846 [Trebouxia sp. C0009 RCD-2024]